MSKFTLKYAAGETELGSIEFEFELSGLTVNGQSVSDANAEWLVKYGCRKGFADSYAGKSGDEAQAEFDKRLDKMLNGTMTVRTSDAKESLVMQYARHDATRAIGIARKKPDMSESSARKAIGGTDKFAILVGKLVEKNRADYEARAVAELLARKESVAGVDADLLAEIDSLADEAEAAEKAEAEKVASAALAAATPKPELIKAKKKAA